jgi:hypothetical protein
MVTNTTSNFGYIQVISNNGPHRASFHVTRCTWSRCSHLWSQRICSSETDSSHRISSLIKQLVCVENRQCASFLFGLSAIKLQDVKMQDGPR